MRDRHATSSSAAASDTDAASAPGKRTLTDRLGVQRRAASSPAVVPMLALQLRQEPAGEDPFGMHLLDTASAGVAGGGGAVPYADRIQPLMPGLDLSTVRAHQGEAAHTASRAIGAEAYAVGNDIALPASPSVDLVAHELAHVAQQREGVSLAGGVGVVGDRYEQNADAVAARVAAGRSAADLMPTGESVQARAVQLSPSDDGDDTDAADQGLALGELGADEVPASYQVTWEEVAAAGAGTDNDALDIAWIDGLGDIARQIDGGFGRGTQHKGKAYLKDAKLKAIADKYKSDTAALQDATLTRTGETAKQAKKHKTFKKDAEYLHEQGQLDADAGAARNARLAELDAENTEKKSSHGSKLVKGVPKKVTWGEGRTLARIDFMAWGIHVFGSKEALKSHYKAVKHVPGFAAGLRMAAAAADRLEKARDWFKDKYKGSTFCDTDVGQALRGRHEGTHPKGLLGHPLGFSIDFKAAENPHQHDASTEYMLKKFGGKDGKDGHNQLDAGLTTKDVAQLGRDTAADPKKDPTAKQQAILDRVGAAYDDMFATSEQFKHALGDGVAQLQAARDLYGNTRDKRARLAKLPEGPEHDALQAEIDADLKSVQDTLDTVFGPWKAELEQLNAADSEGRDPTAMVATSKKAVAKVKAEVKKAKHAKELRKAITAHRLVLATFQPDFADEDFDTVKKDALAHIDAVAANTDAANAVSVRQTLIKRFTDASLLFGTIERKDGHWNTKMEVSGASVMQYVEHGFIRHDELGTDAANPKEVFNRDFMQCMVRFGFYPGAAWGAVDTMHFDFQEGMDTIKAGSYSPEG